MTNLRHKLSAKDFQISNLTKMVTENQNVTLQHSDQKYEAQLQALHQNYESALKKLDKVRDLVTDNRLENLKNLVKRGEI